MSALSETANRQFLWSQTANAEKRRIDFARWATFGFSIFGALLATIASQLDESLLRTSLAVAGAVSLAVMTFVTSRFLGGTQLRNWIRCRAASEALKRESYKYAATAAPYDDLANRDSLLNNERERIEHDVDDLLGLQVPSEGKGSAPHDPLTHDDYIARRVQGQISYYTKKADAYRVTVNNLRRTELILSLAATIVTAAVGVAGKDVLGFKEVGFRFDFVAVTAVITTVAGAILAHIEASRFDFLITSYRAAARRLAAELSGVTDNSGGLGGGWSAFVNRCEIILAEENTTWIAKWSK